MSFFLIRFFLVPTIISFCFALIFNPKWVGWVGNVLAEKLLAEKKLDDTAKQIIADAIPEVAAEALYSGKLIDATPFFTVILKSSSVGYSELKRALIFSSTFFIVDLTVYLKTSSHNWKSVLIVEKTSWDKNCS